ncbi:uncharacterized protein LOC135690240 isoform X1 [Rhopilema esculentum]|uniref:uncharacterized protein LOC135690240 isoform X1 n=2 Tax=Rhopilema esculentum TaxID=499914 RepID=UPI0031DE7820
MSLRKLFHGVSLWGIAKRKSSSTSSQLDGQLGPRDNTGLSDVWFTGEDSFCHGRMTPGPEMVLKQGFLYKKRERSSSMLLRKSWQSGYFVLKKCSSYSGLLLDEYRDASLRVAKQTLFLDTVKHVGPVNTARSKQYAFQVVVLGRSPLFFACDNEILRAEWIGVFSRYTEEITDSAFAHGRTSPEGGPSGSARQGRAVAVAGFYGDAKPEENNDKSALENKGYQVVIQKTALAEDNNLHGGYLLRVSKTRIFLKQIDGKEYVLSWPLTHLRGFKSQPEHQIVVLETGRRCHFGIGRLCLKTRYAESIIRDIRGATSTESISSGNSSDSDAEAVHPAVRRSQSEEKCSVTVSVRPRRIVSKRVINQVDVGREASPEISLPNMGKAVGKTLHPISATPEVNASVCDVDRVSKDIFFFEESLEDTVTTTVATSKAESWKTSSTFGKTMIDSRSDNENSSNEFEEETKRYSYVDIIHDEEGDTPLSSDEASTLLAQVVADLTEPQKRNNFVKSNSTGGIQGKPTEINEARRASAPAVGSREFITSATSEEDLQGSALSTQWKLRLEKINEVSFTDATDGEQHLSPNNSINENGVHERPRSLSELLANECQLPTQVQIGKQRSKTILGLTQSNAVSSLTDLSISRHKGLKPTLSMKSPYDLERDMCLFNCSACTWKVPSFPKSRVIKEVECAGGIENSRAMLSMSPLPPEFHNSNIVDSNENDTERAGALPPLSSAFNSNAPARPPRSTEGKVQRCRSRSRSSPPPLPDRNQSQAIISPREQLSFPRTNLATDSGSITRPYTNTPPKVQPRSPNSTPLPCSGHEENSENVSPPPIPPKPDSLSAAFKKSSLEQSRLTGANLHGSSRRLVIERRSEGYPWEVDRQMGSDAFKDGSPQFGRVKRPVVTLTPPRSPESQRHHRSLMHAISMSDPDISEHLEKSINSRIALSSTRSSPNS